MGRKDVVKYIIQKKVPEMRKENQAVQTKNIILRWDFRQIHQILKSSDNVTSLSLSLKKCLIMSVSKSLLKNGESYGKKKKHGGKQSICESINTKQLRNYDQKSVILDNIEVT